ncbi:plasmid fertility inhibition factor family protein [Thiohalospira halophila]|uniref:plasmid fertility inhibition factor family protein n=1 Tax=Thiohalospira halophila TaxID=381300 RepID=UPI00117E4A6F|nr:hypothetical protein [Thiohalospira halophila]
MKIEAEATRDYLIPYFVYSAKLEQLWRKDALYIRQWQGEPKSVWFRRSRPKKERVAFYVPHLNIELDTHGYAISFTNGRHRTRWLLQAGKKEVPVGLEEGEIALADELGLLARTVRADDELQLP